MSRHSISSITVHELIEMSGLQGLVRGDSGIVVTGISQDSREIQTGDLFCCVRGQKFDGREFISMAIRNGAVAILVEERISDIPEHIAQIEVEDVREAMGPLASAAFGFPSKSLSIVGITGTNGKTTTAAILASILRVSGRTIEIIGTLSGVHTTPEAIDLQAMLARFVDTGVDSVVMEVSSHALAQYRVNGIVFDLAIFTNLGHDHLDFHGTQEDYFAAKARLFHPTLALHGVVNVDDPHGQLLLDVGAIPITAFSVTDASDVSIGIDKVSFNWHNIAISVPIGGSYSVVNAIAAAAAAEVLKISATNIERGCASVDAVPGRFEAVPNDQGFEVIVDFAHTAEGLEGILSSVRTLTQGRILLVFGCGGERDAAKRPRMGAVAAALADVVIVTSDNPRGEDPEAIISEVMAEISGSKADVRAIVNRADAIESAIIDARRGDIVVVAGKGHEKTQEINGVLIPFSDVETATLALQNRKGD
jgi:UDP-N-acetylmuramoyl-L-alanyl-D-glutamate--2,6-diaminopimelate ligase